MTLLREITVTCWPTYVLVWVKTAWVRFTVVAPPMPAEPAAPYDVCAERVPTQGVANCTRASAIKSGLHHEWGSLCTMIDGF